MRKSILSIFLTLSVFSFAELFEDPQNFQITIDGVTYESYRYKMHDGSYEAYYDYFVKPVAADLNIVALNIPEEITVSPEIDTVDKTNHTYKVFEFDGKVFDECKNIKSISIHMDSSSYGYVYDSNIQYVEWRYYPPTFLFYGNNFPPKSVETLDISVDKSYGYGNIPMYYQTKDNILYYYDWGEIPRVMELCYIPSSSPIKELTVPEDVTQIWSKVFANTNIESINITNSSIKIGDNVFGDSYNLKELVLQNELENGYSWTQNLPRNVNFFAPASSHKQIREYWKGENLYDYPPKPLIVNATAENGVVQFGLNYPYMVIVDSVKVASLTLDENYVETYKLCELSQKDGVYSVGCCPISNNITLTVYSTIEDNVDVTYANVYQKSSQLIVSESEVAYGNVSIVVENIPQSATLDSISVNMRTLDDYYNKFIYFKGKDFKADGNRYSFSVSPIISEMIGGYLYYSMVYKGVKLRSCREFKTAKQERTASFNEEISEINNNELTIGLNPDFSNVSSKVEDYGYRLRIWNWQGYNKLDKIHETISAKDKDSITFSPLIDTAYELTPYVTINGISWLGDAKKIDVPKIDIVPKVIASEPGKVVLSLGLPYRINCDTLSCEWVIDNESIVVENDTTIVISGPIETSFRKNVNSVLFRYEMPTIFGTATESRYRNFQNSVSWIIETPGLEFKTLAAKAASDAKAVILAEVNVNNNDEGFGFEWRRYDAPELVPSNKVSCPVVGGTMSGRLNNLSANTYYKYRPYYEAADGTIYYGDWMAFGTADAYVYFEPMVNTYEPTEITETSAVLSGYALGGSDDIIEQGFEYSVAETTEVYKVTAEGEKMTANLTDLLPGTTYIARAYVMDSKATTRGDMVVFTTAGEPQDAIEEVAAECETPQEFDIWTLQGVCVKRGASDLSGLRPGLYIANGRKVLIR